MDFFQHCSVLFGVQTVALWRREAGVSVVGVQGAHFTGLLWQLPGAACPAFSPDGHVLALERGGRPSCT